MAMKDYTTNNTEKVERLVKQQHKRNTWRRAVMIPAILIVVLVVGILTVPAFTQTRKTYCGNEEHEHTGECYVDALVCGHEDGEVAAETVSHVSIDCTEEVHKHTKDCFDRDNQVICGYADYVVHTHDSNCYDAAGSLICSLKEIKEHKHTGNCYEVVKEVTCGQKEEAPHTHTDACYGVTSILSCGQEEAEPHAHTTECYTVRVENELSCTQPEDDGHTHTDACYGEGEHVESNLICGQTERAAHHHDDSCYTAREYSDLTCGKQETAGHTHAPECYTEKESLICGKQETAGHTHAPECYTERKTLTCGKEEVILHTHTEEAKCFERDDKGNLHLVCKELEVREHQHTADCIHVEEEVIESAHVHTADCYIKELGCGQAEHTHNDECYVNPEKTTDLMAMPVQVKVLTCDKEEHEHTSECYDAGLNIACGKVEHTHADSCYAVSMVPAADVKTMEGEIATLALNIPNTTRPLDEKNTKRVKGVKFTDMVYNPQTGAYETTFRIDWSVTGKDMAENGNKFEYELPKELVPDELVNNGRWYTAFDKNGERSFKYQYVERNGKVYLEIEYFPEYVENHRGTINSGVEFDSQIWFSDSEDEKHFQFGDPSHGSYDLTIERKARDFNLNVSKNVDMVENADGTITLNYKVKVSAPNGTPGTVDVNDIMKKGSEYVGMPEITVTKRTYTRNGSSWNYSDSRVNVGDPKNGGYRLVERAKGQFDIELPQMPQSDNTYCEYYITYSYTVNPKDLPNGRHEFSNAALAKSGDLQDSDGSSVWIEHESIKKTGKLVDDEIEWTITVNSLKDDLSDWTLYDEYFKQHHITPDKLTVTQDGVSIDATKGDYKFEYNSDGSISGIKFNPGNHHTYTFTFRTPANETNKNYTNTAYLKKGNQEHNSSSSVWVPDKGGNQGGTGGNQGGDQTNWKEKGHKEIVDVELVDGKLILHWQVEIYLNPGDKIPVNEEMYDQFDSQVMTPDQFRDLYDSISSEPWFSNVILYYNNNPNNTVDTLKDDTRITNFTIKVVTPIEYGNTIDGKIVIDYYTTSEKAVSGNSDQLLNRFWHFERRHFSDGFEKQDGHGNRDDVTLLDPMSDNGTYAIVSWNLKIVFAQDNNHESAKIVEHLPAGLTFDSISANGLKGGFTLNDCSWKVVEDGDPNNGGHYDLIIDIPGSLAREHKNHGITFMINCKLEGDLYKQWKSGEFDEKDLTFTNYAELFVDNKKVNEDTQTQKPDPSEKPGGGGDSSSSGVGKSLEFNKNPEEPDDTLHYFIDINKDQTVYEQDGIKAELTLTDTLTYKDYYVPKDGNWSDPGLGWQKSAGWQFDYQLIETSVKLYYAKLGEDGKPIYENGHMVPDKLVDFDDWSWEPGERVLSEDHQYGYLDSTWQNRFVITEWEKTITAKIPNNGLAMVLVYDYKINLSWDKDYNWGYGPENATRPILGHVENDVSLEGKGSDGVNKDVESKNSDTRGWSETQDGSFTLEKTDSKNYSVKPAGAKFGLFEYDPVSGDFVQISVGGVKDFYTQNRTGKITIESDKDSNGFNVTITDGDPTSVDPKFDERETKGTLKANTVYYWMELEPAEGYLKEDPAPKFYFWFPDGSGSIAGYTSEMSSGHDMSKPAATQRVLNTKFVQGMEITKVDSETKKPLDVTVKFELYGEDGTYYGEYFTDADGRIKLQVTKVDKDDVYVKITDGCDAPHENVKLPASGNFYWKETLPNGYGYVGVDNGEHWFSFEENTDDNTLYLKPGTIHPLEIENERKSGFDYEIDKTDEEGKSLRGAEFTLRRVKTSTSSGQVGYEDWGPYTFKVDDGGKIILHGNVTKQTGPDGKIIAVTINGKDAEFTLETGVLYSWTETKSPSRYRKTNDEYFFFVDDEGKLHAMDSPMSNYKYDIAHVVDSNYHKQQVINKQDDGVRLPATGGAGTKLYTIAGLLMTFGAGAVYIITKRKRWGTGMGR